MDDLGAGPMGTRSLQKLCINRFFNFSSSRPNNREINETGVIRMKNKIPSTKGWKIFPNRLPSKNQILLKGCNRIGARTAVRAKQPEIATNRGVTAES